jgi:hypothetical protein
MGKQRATNMTSQAGKSPGWKPATLLRHYTRGILALIVIVLVVRLALAVWPSEAYARSLEWLSGGADRWVFAGFGILVLPPLVGWTAGTLIRPLLLRHRSLRAILLAEEGLVTEFAPDDARGFTVVIVDWPNSNVTTVGLRTSVSTATEKDGEFAAVFLPRATEPFKGDIRMVRRGIVHETDWTLREYLAFQMSYGAAVPNPVSADTGTASPQP